MDESFEMTDNMSDDSGYDTDKLEDSLVPEEKDEGEKEFIPFFVDEPNFAVGDTKIIPSPPFSKFKIDNRNPKFPMKKRFKHPSMERQNRFRSGSACGVVRASTFTENSLTPEVARKPRPRTTRSASFVDLPVPKLPSSSSFQEENQENQTNRSPSRFKISGLFAKKASPLRRTTSDITPDNPDRKGNPLRHSTNTTGSFCPHDQVYPQVVPLAKKENNVITPATVVRMLNGEFAEHFDRVVVIDCRYLYEYEGGHIKGALNIIPAERERRLQELFFNNPVDRNRTAFILHCEFSSKRGPTTYSTIRSKDRVLNTHRYPQVHYPYLYVMGGGFREFYKSHPSYCEGTYIEMKDKRYKEELKKNKQAERKRSNSFVAPSHQVLRPKQSLSFTSLFS